MQASGGKALATLWVAAILVCGAGFAQDALEERRVDIDVRDAPLAEVVQMISREADVDIILHKDVENERVTLRLTYKPVTVALSAIARTHDLKIERLEGDIFYICRPDSKAESDQRVQRIGFGEGQPTAVAEQPRVVIPTGATRAVEPPPGDARVRVAQPTRQPHLRTETPPPATAEQSRSARALIPMRYMPASQFASLVGCPSVDIALNGRETYYRAPVAIPWREVELGDTINRHNGYLNMARRQRYVIDPVQQLRAQALAVREQFGPQAGGPGGGPGGGQLGGQGGQGGQAVFQLPEGIEELVGYDLISALVVRGEPDAIEELRELVELLDLPPQQIEVEARFVSLSVSDADSLGISWTMTDGTTTVTGSTPAQGGASIAIRTATGNFQTLITAIVRNNQGKVVNAPKVATQNGQPAMVAFQQTIPVTISDTVITDASQTVSTTIETIPVTTALIVVPRVTGQPPNESITTVIQPQVADVTGFVDNPSGGTIPIVAMQQISTMLRVRNGETIALGGLVRKNNSYSTTKIPLLGDLPFIGSLFRSNTRNLDESELLIFVTPTIMRELFYNQGPAAVG